MVRNNSPKSLVSGPIWILQLWLNALGSSLLDFGTTLQNQSRYERLEKLFLFLCDLPWFVDTMWIHLSAFVEREIGSALFTKPIDSPDLKILLFGPIIFVKPCFWLDFLVKRKLESILVSQIQWLVNLVSVKLS